MYHTIRHTLYTMWWCGECGWEGVVGRVCSTPLWYPQPPPRPTFLPLRLLPRNHPGHHTAFSWCSDFLHCLCYATITSGRELTTWRYSTPEQIHTVSKSLLDTWTFFSTRYYRARAKRPTTPPPPYPVMFPRQRAFLHFVISTCFSGHGVCLRLISWCLECPAVRFRLEFPLTWCVVLEERPYECIYRKRWDSNH